MKLFSCKEEYLKNAKNYQGKEKFLCKILLNKDLYDIEMTEDEKKEIMSINNNDLFNNNNFDIDNIPWIISKYVFENNQEHGYKLHKGDIFKLGKYILRVREIGIDDDKKHFFIENKNTQKYIKNRSISINNVSQLPLNQQNENYFSALNLDQYLNGQRNEDNQNNNFNENRSNGSHVQIIKNESENNSHNDLSENNKSNKNIDENNNNFVSIIPANRSQNDDINNGNRNENKNSQKVISIYYSNYSQQNNSHSKNNEIISQNGSANNEKEKENHYFINIINSSNIENNNNNILDDSKNKINNNSLGYQTFHNNNIINSSYNNSGKNISNSFRNIEKENENSKHLNLLYLNSGKNISGSSRNDENENENSKNLININNNKNCEQIKSSFKALKSTASFKKKKMTDIIQKKILKNSLSIEKNGKPICRICLSEEYEENNPLIHPCNCDGTMKYIHLQCLKLLIQSKIKKTETESCKVFTFKTLECEICKMAFPEKIKIKGIIFSIIDFEKPDKDYIILDGLIKEIPEEKSIFIVHFKNKKEIKIGRATDANIRLSDISVSRAHAIISQFNDSFYLHDTNSKFGTLISAGNKFCILYKKPFSVQKGNILFEFLMKKTFCATLRCYNPSVILYKTYNDFLDETFAYKNQYKDDELLIREKTKTVSEYSGNTIIKPTQIRVKSSKNIDFFDNDNNDNNESDNNIKKNNNSLQSKDKNSNNQSNSYNNEKNNNNRQNNNNQQIHFEGNNISLGVNKTQDLFNISQKNENIKLNSKVGITLENNNGNENSLLYNNVNSVSNDKK